MIEHPDEVGWSGAMPPKPPRPDWDRYFMDLARAARTRASCSRRQVGAVIVLDRCVVSTGYNGTPRGTPHCDEGGCPRCASTAPSGEALGECLCCHAEENAIVQAARRGARVEGGALYTTHSPCLGCAKMIVNAGIRAVFFHEPYGADKGPAWLLLTRSLACFVWLREAIP